MSGLVWACPDCHSDLQPLDDGNGLWCDACAAHVLWSEADDGTPDYDDDHQETP